MEDYQCGVKRCQKRKEKICIHFTSKCANYKGPHAANFLYYTSRHKVKISAIKERKKSYKNSEKK